MNSSSKPGRSAQRLRGIAVPVALSVFTLTLLFTTQSVMRSPPNAPRPNLTRMLLLNALDWIPWGLLVPLIVVVGSRVRLDGTGRRAVRLAVWLALGVAVIGVQSVVTGLVLRWWSIPEFSPIPRGAPTPPIGRYLWNWMLGGAGFNFIIFLMIAGVFHAALYYQDLRSRQLREADLEARLAHAELNVLRMQLQPHFFFNALHTISSLMVSDVPTAHRVIAALGDLLRSSLDHTARQEIPLGEEMAFVGRYLEIQQARFRSRLTVETDVPAALLDALVPSLVLQPLVENAIRHGIQAHTGSGTIWISAERRGDRLVLAVRDNGSTNAAAAHEPPAPGVGLRNVESRLTQLYAGASSFSALRGADGRFEVSLALPFHLVPGLYPAATNGR